MPRDRVRVVWMDGPQAYGRTAADDAGFEAAFLAKEIGRPVRVQWMRQEETAWDTKGPAYAFKMRGALDAQGNLVALDYDARAADHNHLGYNEHDTVLIAQLTGMRRAEPARGRASTPSDMYVIPNRRTTTQVVRAAAGVGNAASHRQPARSRRPAGDVRVRVVHRRARGGGEGRSGRVPPEAAHARAPTDDSGFKRARSIACIKAAAEKFGWDAASVAEAARGSGDILTGRGIAYAYRSQTVVAEIAEVEVNRRTGHVWVKRFVCAHDCGLVINPEALRRTVECGMLHSLSRALHEEVRSTARRSRASTGSRIRR